MKNICCAYILHNESLSTSFVVDEFLLGFCLKYMLCVTADLFTCTPKSYSLDLHVKLRRTFLKEVLRFWDT